MSVKLSPMFNSQIVDENGNPAAGWKIHTYVAGSVDAPQAAYVDSEGEVAHANPIVLDALGFPTNGQIWLTSGQSYKLVLTDENDVVKETADNISGVNDASIATSQWQSSGMTPTYVSSTSFTVPGDQTSEFHVGRRLQMTVTAGTVYGTIRTSAFTTLTTVTVTMETGSALDSGLSTVNLSILRADRPALPGSAAARAVLGANGWDLVSFTTASDGATIDFTGLSGYDNDYMVCIRGLIPATSGAVLKMRVSQAGSFKTDANYGYFTMLVNSASSGSGVSTAINSTTGTAAQISGAVTTVVAEGGVVGDVEICNCSDTASYKHYRFSSNAYSSTAGMQHLTGGGSYRGSAAAVDGIRLMFDTGNIALGTAYLYRRRKTLS